MPLTWPGIEPATSDIEGFRGWRTWCVDKLQGFYRVVLVLVADVSTAVLSSSEQLLDKEKVSKNRKRIGRTNLKVIAVNRLTYLVLLLFRLTYLVFSQIDYTGGRVGEEEEEEEAKVWGREEARVRRRKEEEELEREKKKKKKKKKQGLGDGKKKQDLGNEKKKQEFGDKKKKKKKQELEDKKQEIEDGKKTQELRDGKKTFRYYVITEYDIIFIGTCAIKTSYERYSINVSSIKTDTSDLVNLGYSERNTAGPQRFTITEVDCILKSIKDGKNKMKRIDGAEKNSLRNRDSIPGFQLYVLTLFPLSHTGFQFRCWIESS
ncbi:hypothetical protein ANN_15442 [Periplaneta americana]|uniref:Uncharacterized protein n=1 Tax=Periplaneta americana TaxID=6978 RepID=A0ABQ8SIA4_PERAM|nr:hypothetical protein ANN_15442 [Periplaneta americana]